MLNVIPFPENKIIFERVKASGFNRSRELSRSSNMVLFFGNGIMSLLHRSLLIPLLLIGSLLQGPLLCHDIPNADSPESKTETKEDEFILTPTPHWQDKEAPLYHTPNESTRGLKSHILPFSIWYDPFVWEESPALNEYAERSFKLKKSDAYAIIVTDKNQFAIASLNDIVIKNAKASGFESAKIISNEKRKVNGHEVLFMHWAALLQGIHVDFLSYVYSGPEGSVFIHTYTPEILYKKNRRQMEALLNGFTLEKKQHKKRDDS